MYNHEGSRSCEHNWVEGDGANWAADQPGDGTKGPFLASPSRQCLSRCPRRRQASPCSCGTGWERSVMSRTRESLNPRRRWLSSVPEARELRLRVTAGNGFSRGTACSLRRSLLRQSSHLLRALPVNLMAQPDDSYTDPVEQWIRAEYTESIVLVELRPKDVSAVRDLWDKVSPICGKGATARTRQRKKICKMHAHATGFVVRTDRAYTWVLTCAHILSSLFSAQYPISAQTLENLYDAWILCDHCEQRYLRENVPNRAREYTPAEVIEINCQTDLLLLRVARGDFRVRCVRHHIAVPIAEAFPMPLARTVLLSWPYLRERTAVSGKTIHPSRAYSSISDVNTQGYQMRLSEVNIASDFGSSGAPLITGENAIGVLQSGDTMFTYFISLHDLRTTLIDWGVIE